MPRESHKRRVRYAVVGCILSSVASGRTIAIEAEDAVAVVFAVASVGLAGYLNTNYVSGLQALLDGASERYGGPQCGHEFGQVSCWRARHRWNVAHDIRSRQLTRLGEGLDKKARSRRKQATTSKPFTEASAATSAAPFVSCAPRMGLVAPLTAPALCRLAPSPH